MSEEIRGDAELSLVASEESLPDGIVGSFEGLVLREGEVNRNGHLLLSGAAKEARGLPLIRGHDESGESLGRVDIIRAGKEMRFRGQFYDTPAGKAAHHDAKMRAAAGGAVRVSYGMRAAKKRSPTAAERAKGARIVASETEQYELSLVVNGAVPDAKAEMVASDSGAADASFERRRVLDQRALNALKGVFDD